MAQLAHPKDTLPDGRKVSFAPFLGRFSVFMEHLGAGVASSYNIGYTAVKREAWLLDYAVGLYPYQLPIVNSGIEGYTIPTSLSLQFGRRKSRLNFKLGYSVSWTPGLKDSPWPSCGSNCPGPTQHRGFFSLGYVLQHHHGFFFGVNAYGIVQFTPTEQRHMTPFPDSDIYPWGGVTFGYRIPSQLQLLTWKERKARKVLRSRDDKVKKAKDEGTPIAEEEVALSALELELVAERMKKLEEREVRMALRELRDNGPHQVFVEAFGPAHIWSVNYQFTAQVKPASIVHAYGRVGLSGLPGGVFESKAVATMPVAGGIMLMKGYRGGGIGAGVAPVITNEGALELVSFVGIDLQFHVAHGITMGVGYQTMFDPEQVHRYQRVSQWAGCSVGYRFKRKPRT
ncbi:MAG: hypothetical protein K9J06_05685 [Flavobacteriales bacterium]|nr:hypothetical protein [Flavobacteriales bacterium]